MFHLVSGLFKFLTRKDEYNVLILGLDDAGKSVSILNMLIPHALIKLPKCS